MGIPLACSASTQCSTTSCSTGFPPPPPRRRGSTVHSKPELELIDLPVAFSQSPRDIGGPSRRWAEERFRNIVYRNLVARGGHFAAFEQPEIFIEEIRAGFRAIRAASS